MLEKTHWIERNNNTGLLHRYELLVKLSTFIAGVRYCQGRATNEQGLANAESNPENWIETYYKPMQARFEYFLERNNHSEHAHKVVDDIKLNSICTKKFKDYYSYGFYIARKI